MNLNSHSIIISFFLLLCKSPHTLSSPATAAITDELALIDFKTLIRDPTNALSSWNSSLPTCQWEGITCNAEGRVARIELVELQLAGPISPGITNITFLESINLSYNELVGTLPADIDRLSNLVNLTARVNFLSGEIPAGIVRCSRLRFLNLRANLLSGEIPRDLGFLQNLQGINLYGNNITGTIPSSIGNISSLEFIVFAKNELYGTIPESIGRLFNLQSLQMAINKLTGELPPSFFNLSSLYGVYLGFNRLEGTLPSSIFNTMPNIQYFLLNDNRFHGSIPQSVSNASYLVEIALSNNAFSGIIPSRLGNSEYMYRVELSRNQLEAEKLGDWDFMEFLVNCTQLLILGLRENNLRGLLPRSISNLSAGITVLLLSQNRIEGNLPADIGNLVNLTVFEAHGNLLTGTLPSSIGKLNSLQRLTLHENRFNGWIPDSLSNITSLNQLYMQNNFFEGSIPANFERLENLQELDLSWNRLSGEIPKQLFSIQSLSVNLDLSNNLLTGKLPAEIGGLKNLNSFAAANNQFSGEIPGSIGNCLGLEYLFLQGNSFQGAIPQSLNSLKGLRELDLSSNILNQSIPTFLESFKGLQLLNLSFNEFEGQVPANGVFKNYSAVSLNGNKHLCEVDGKLQLPLCDHTYDFSKSNGTKKNRNLALKISIPAAGVALCIAAGIFAFVCLCRVKRLQRKPSMDLIDGQFRRTSYAELLKATNEFSSSNLIGAGSFGSVYKGIIDPDETMVAIKVLNLDRSGASKSFMAECDALKGIRHRNLVKILTACSSVDLHGNDFKALVLKYMPNGSLDQWLHPDESDSETKMLTLDQRLSIAIDVASAIDYLHNHGPAPIVHCDLKPSNVLLDDDMIAHLSDFGLAKILLEMDSNQTASIGIKGTIGYLPPEYGMGGQSSPQGDVYSYGILLLELFTGRRPTDDMFEHDRSLRYYVERSHIVHIESIIDPYLIEEARNRGQEIRVDIHEELKCFDSVIRIALLCSLNDSRERMEMEDVVNQLKLIRKTLERELHQ